MASTDFPMCNLCDPPRRHARGEKHQFPPSARIRVAPKAPSQSPPKSRPARAVAAPGSNVVVLTKAEAEKLYPAPRRGKNRLIPLAQGLKDAVRAAKNVDKDKRKKAKVTRSGAPVDVPVDPKIAKRRQQIRDAVARHRAKNAPALAKT